MNVLEYIQDKLKVGKVHMTLLDPEKEIEAVHVCEHIEGSGSDAIMLGGSTGVNEQKLDDTIRELKRCTELPIILFPSSSRSLSRHADAIYFMSLLNSREVRIVVGEQKRAARIIKDYGIETIPMGYIIVEPGMKVGEVGQAEVVKRDDIDSAVGYALVAQFFGMKLVYLEAGSGAPVPVPYGMVSKVKEEIDVPLIVGGGIRTPEDAGALAKAGADIIVTGTIVEKDAQVLGSIVKSVKETLIQ
jgi:phosphoglycerol geranylgeranyltransferase